MNLADQSYIWTAARAAEDHLVIGADKRVVHGMRSFGAFAAGLSKKQRGGKLDTYPNSNRNIVSNKEGDLQFGGHPGDEGKLEHERNRIAKY